MRNVWLDAGKNTLKNHGFECITWMVNGEWLLYNCTERFSSGAYFCIMEFIKIANFEFQILWGQGKSEHVTIVLSACFGMVLNILKKAAEYSLFVGHMNVLYGWVKGLWWKGWTKESSLVKIYECKGYGLCTGVRHLTAQDSSSCPKEKLLNFKISATQWGSYFGLVSDCFDMIKLLICMVRHDIDRYCCWLMHRKWKIEALLDFY